MSEAKRREHARKQEAEKVNLEKEVIKQMRQEYEQKKLAMQAVTSKSPKKLASS